MLAIVEDEDGTTSSFFPKIVRSIQIECLKTNFVVVSPKSQKVVVEYFIFRKEEVGRDEGEIASSSGYAWDSLSEGPLLVDRPDKVGGEGDGPIGCPFFSVPISIVQISRSAPPLQHFCNQPI